MTLWPDTNNYQFEIEIIIINEEREKNEEKNSHHRTNDVQQARKMTMTLGMEWDTDEENDINEWVQCVLPCILRMWMHRNENQPLDRHTPCTMDSYFCGIRKIKNKSEPKKWEKWNFIIKLKMKKIYRATETIKNEKNKMNRDTHTYKNCCEMNDCIFLWFIMICHSDDDRWFHLWVYLGLIPLLFLFNVCLFLWASECRYNNNNIYWILSSRKDCAMQSNKIRIVKAIHFRRTVEQRGTDGNNVKT